MMRHSRVLFDSILIVGCGYTGSFIAESAQALGLKVVATRRQWREKPSFPTLSLDVTASVDWTTLIQPGVAVIWSVPTLPELTDPDQPLRDALQVARNADVPFLYISSTSVFGQHDGAVVYDDSECRPDTPTAQMRHASETLVLQYSRGIVARPAGIFGPGRDLANSMASGRYEVVDPAKLTNRIHVKDLARAVLFLLDHPESYGRAFNLADGNPATVGDLAEFLVAQYAIPRPRTTTLEAYRARHGEDAAARWINAHRVEPKAIKELGFTFEFNDVFEAYRTGGIR